MAIQDCVEAIETIVKSNVTVTGSEVFPSEEQRTGVFAVSFEDSGDFEGRSADWAQSFHGVSTYILGAKTNMLQTYKTLEGEMENIAIAILKDPTLGGNCDTIDGVTYQKATLNLAGVDYAGYQLTVNGIKIGRDLT
jgi:hypothetical protein